MNKGKVSNLVTKGQVLWVDLPDVESGSVQKGRRPVVVISNNKGNQFSPVILVAPLTSKKKKHLPTHVDVFASETNGIKSDSTVLCEQLFTIDKNSILDSIGRVSEEVMTKINKALCISLAL